MENQAMTQTSSAASQRKKAVLYTRCCDGDATSEELHEMYDQEREITFTTFSRRVDIRPIAKDLGYVSGRHAQGLRMQNDRCVRFFRSKFRGENCYYMDWSCIDHIFVTSSQGQRLRQQQAQH